MSKLIIFNFDGTSNEPSDAAQDVDYRGTKEDDNITNILKFHLMLGGDLLPKSTGADYVSNWDETNQRVFYYHGVGTYGSLLKRMFNAGMASEKSDVATILNMAMKDYKENYQRGDTLLVTGFSRGAALGRRFVALVEKYQQKKHGHVEPFVYEAMYDTVASMGIPNMSRASRPNSDVVFENGHSMPSIVIKALHCVSLDDKRSAFQPTLMNKQDGVVHEVWFSGAHSDIGGGYYRDGLSDISLRYFLQWMTNNVPQAIYKEPTEAMLEVVVPDDVGYEIGLDDVNIQPNPLGKNHQQDRFPILDWLTLTDRLCCVIEDNKPSTEAPLVYQSVAERIHKDSDYRPKSLRNKKHSIVHQDGAITVCKGLRHHI